MGTKFQRPGGGYAGQAGLANATKYQDDSGATPKRAVSSGKVDGDFNYLIDAVNETWDALSSAGFSAALPNQAGNAGKVPVTNGTATGWQLIGNANVQDKGLALGKLADIGGGKLVGAESNGAVAALGIGAGLALSGGALTVSAPVPPVGMIALFAGSSAPAGWLLCFGQAVSRTGYAALFAVIGTTYGAGDGSTTFTLPDLRGRVGLGLDNMGGTDAGRLSVANTLGGSGGAQTKNGSTDGTALTVAQLPPHTHGVQASSAVAGSGGGGGWLTNTGAPTVPATTSTGNGDAHSHTISNLDVLQPYLLLTMIIKT